MADARSARTPAISVVIPTHNRCDLMARMLSALEAQQDGTPVFEVVAVADGCVDGTVAMLQGYRGPFTVRVVEKPGLGPAEARNAGAQAAAAELLLFIDDDVLPTPALVAAHWAAHAGLPDGAAIGPYPPAPHASSDLFRLRSRAWWLKHFNQLDRPGHRFSFRDLLTGNLSMPRRLWIDIGGLDPKFARAREDLELGVRLIARDVPLRYARDALGWHHEHATSSLAGALRRAREEGRSDAHMAIKHPHLGSALDVVRMAGPRSAVASAVLRGRAGGLVELLVPVGVALLALLNSLGLRGPNSALFGRLRNFAYHRGATAALDGNWAKLADPAPAPLVEPFTIDLADGIEIAEQKLSDARPLSVRVIHGGRELGVLPFAAGMERWDGRHLREALAGPLARAMLPLVGGLGDTPENPPPGWSFLGLSDFDHLAAEARRQWARAGL